MGDYLTLDEGVHILVGVRGVIRYTGRLNGLLRIGSWD